jgi:hypothetical protein
MHIIYIIITLKLFMNELYTTEIEHINGDRYIPSGIRPITQGGHLIQEDSDNIT